LTEDANLMLEEGTHVIATEIEPAEKPVPMLGHVTSSYKSPTLGRSIAMAMVKSGGARLGERLWVSRQGGTPIPVTVTETDFLKLREDGDV
jgi:sarcosine oxidase subunit alpha